MPNDWRQHHFYLQQPLVQFHMLVALQRHLQLLVSLTQLPLLIPIPIRITP
jgi:hypothetical protein